MVVGGQQQSKRDNLCVALDLEFHSLRNLD